MIKYASLSKWPRYLRSFCGVNKRCWRIDFNIERSRLSESDSAACSCLLLLLLLLPRDDELRVVNLVDVFSCKFSSQLFFDSLGLCYKPFMDGLCKGVRFGHLVVFDEL